MPTINITLSPRSDTVYSKARNGSFYFQATGSAGGGAWGIYSGNIIGTKHYSAFLGFRFENVTIPQGATINAATLKIYSTAGSMAPTAKIYGNNVDNAGTWGAGNKLGNISKTAQSTTLGAAAMPMSNDVTAIVQAIVNRAGWTSGNSEAFGIFPKGTAASKHSVFAYTFTSGGTLPGHGAPVLSVTYTIPSGQIFMGWLPQYG